MDGDEAKESAADGDPSASRAMGLDAPCAHESTQPTKKQQKRKRASTAFDMVDNESASAEWRREIDELFEYYKEVSGHHLNPEELACSTCNSIIACLLEESSLPYAKLTDEIYKKMKLQNGVAVTKSLVCSSVLNIGKRSSYGISSMDVDELEDESELTLWCWETRDLDLLPSHLHSSLSIRRTARKLIHERILVLSGKLAVKGSPKGHGNQSSQSVNAGEMLNLDGIRSCIEKLKQNNDADITKMQSKTKAEELQAIKNAVMDQEKIERQVQKEQKKKDLELKHMNEKAEKEAKRIETENKRLKKHQEQVEREKKRREKEQVELKRQASIQKQANIMERFLRRKTNSNMKSSDTHHLVNTTHSKSSEIFGEFAVAATSAMDRTLSQANCLRVEEFLLAHVARWRKLSQHNRLGRWGVRISPKIQLFHELKLQKSTATACSENMLTPTKPLLSQENPGSPDFSKLDELKTPSHENNSRSKTTQNSTPSSVLFVKKLLQFDRSHRPAYYGTWRKNSTTVSARHPFKRDPDFNYEADSDEEWEEEDPGERLSDFENDDEETMNEHDSKIDEEEEAENSFVVPNDYLSEDEGVQYEPLSGKFDETCSMLSTPWVTVEELNVLLQRQKALHNFTEQALRKDRPLVISNLDHRKLDLLKAEDITGILKVEQLCLQALCMRKYPGGPIIDVPVDINASIEEDQEFCQSNRKSPRTPVASKSILDSDMLEFVKLITSCSQGMGKLVELLQGRFPCVSKARLKNKVREIAEFSNNRWQVKKEVLDRFGLSLSPGKGGSPKCAASHFPQGCQPPDNSGMAVESSPKSALEPAVGKQGIAVQESGGSPRHSDH